MIFALNAERSPMINIVEDRFTLSLLSYFQFCHANSALSPVKSIKEILLHLVPAIDGFKLQVSILVESNTFKGSDKLFH